MLRKIIAYAVLALFAILALKVAFALLGTLVGLAIAVLVFAAIGYVCYVILRIVSPGAAAWLRGLIQGPRPPVTPTT
jgi:hypothetical protein